MYRQNLRRAFELQSTRMWDLLPSKNKQEFMLISKNDMDTAKDMAFYSFLNTPENLKKRKT